MAGYILNTDYTEIESLTSMRVMVSSALLYTFTVSQQSPRSISCSLPSPTSSRTASRWKGCMITDGDLCCTVWLVSLDLKSFTEH